MRVLIYIESFPIREAKGVFDYVAKEFIPILRSSTPSFDVRMYAPKVVFDSFNAEELSAVENRLIHSTIDEDNYFRQNTGQWETKGVSNWLDMMQGGNQADHYVRILERVWSLFPFDIIVHWGENGAVSRFVDKRKITRVGMELGCTRKPLFDSLVGDVYGTNGSAILPRLDSDELIRAVGGNKLSAAEAMFHFSENIESRPFELQFEPFAQNNEFSRILKSTRPIALLALQLHDDANLLSFSQYNTPEEVVLDVVPRLVEAGYQVIIKTHPAGRVRHNSQAAFAIAKGAVSQWSDHVIWLDASRVAVDNWQLLPYVSLVVTVNSSLGFEALYFDKDVCVLGEAIYKPKGVFPELDDYLSGRFDREQYLENISYLREFVLCAYLMDHSILRSAPKFEYFLRALDSGFSSFGADPAELARYIYSVFGPVRKQEIRTATLKGFSIPGQNEFRRPSVSDTPEESSSSYDDEASIAERMESAFKSAAHSVMLGLGTTDFDAFEFALDTALSNESQLEEFVRESGLVDSVFYLNYKDVKNAKVDPVSHWCRNGIKEQRQFRRKLVIHSKSELRDQFLRAAETLRDTSLLPQFELSPSSAAQRDDALSQIQALVSESSNRVIVVAHLYYTHLVDELLGYLSQIPEDYDLVVTMPNWGNTVIRSKVSRFKEDAVFYPAPNRGRDIGPFVDVLPTIVQATYDAVLHIHTKAGYFFENGFRRDLGEAWRCESLNSLLGSSDKIAQILSLLRADEKVSMVGPSAFYLGLDDFPYHDRGQFAKTALGDASGDGFFAGTMFWAKPSIFEPMVKRTGLSILNFSEETGANDGELAHLIERAFGQAASLDGRTIVGASSDLSKDGQSDDYFDFSLRPNKESLHNRMISISDRLSEIKAEVRPKMRIV